MSTKPGADPTELRPRQSEVGLVLSRDVDEAQRQRPHPTPTREREPNRERRKDLVKGGFEATIGKRLRAHLDARLHDAARDGPESSAH